MLPHVQKVSDLTVVDQEGGRKMKPVDYQRAMRYTTPSTLEALKHHGGRNDVFLPYGVSPEGFLTDQPIGIKLAEDDYVRVRYVRFAQQFTS